MGEKKTYDDIDKDYAGKRNMLIEEALRHTNKKHRVRFPGGNEAAREAWTSAWNLSFHTKMSELWAGRKSPCPTCGGKGVV